MFSMLQQNTQFGQGTMKMWVFCVRGFVFGDRPIKTILDFEIKFFDYCFVAFGI
jgi:hypothetical protein